MGSSKVRGRQKRTSHRFFDGREPYPLDVVVDDANVTSPYCVTSHTWGSPGNLGQLGGIIKSRDLF